jgi:hypothetical protein
LKELRAYNAAVQTGIPFNPNIKDGRRTEGLAIPKSNWANVLDTPPFEAYAVTCGITFTFGGLRINTDAQVISTDGLPIPGLYAAGELGWRDFLLQLSRGYRAHEWRGVRADRGHERGTVRAAGGKLEKLSGQSGEAHPSLSHLPWLFGVLSHIVSCASVTNWARGT